MRDEELQEFDNSREQELHQLRAELEKVRNRLRTEKRILEVLITADHLSEETVSKARKLINSFE